MFLLLAGERLEKGSEALVDKIYAALQVSQSTAKLLKVVDSI
jgi:hypothetical protein